MSDKKLKQRDEIAKEYKWNIEDMYPDESAWDKDLEECLKAAENFAKYNGRLTESAQTLLAALKDNDAISWLSIKVM